jgi:aryl-alcohol dehydrogenase-like predicted oxidoreductase
LGKSGLEVAWLIARPSITAPIASATSLEQLNDLVAATKLELDQAAIGLLDRASAGQKSQARTQST